MSEKRDEWKYGKEKVWFGKSGKTSGSDLSGIDVHDSTPCCCCHRCDTVMTVC